MSFRRVDPVSEPTAEQVDEVAELLGRRPDGPFEVVVVDDSGSAVVIRNGPFMGDGRPMPTTFWLVGRELVKAVSRLEGEGGVRRAEAEVDPKALAATHRRYAAARESLIPPDHEGPRPSGGVGGTRVGVKCLHTHLAHHLAAGDDPVGEWTLEHLGESS